MKHNDILILLRKTHLLQGSLLEALASENITRHFADLLSQQCTSLAELCSDMAGEEGIDEPYVSHSDADNEVHAIITPPWQSTPGDSHQIADPHTATDNQTAVQSAYETDLYEEEEEDDSALEVFDENDETEENIEGKHPDLSFITINERAMFRRTLFDNNKEDFNKTMDMIQSLSGYSDAVNYLCNDLEWTPETNEAQTEFLNKIHECFRMAR